MHKALKYKTRQPRVRRRAKRAKKGERPSSPPPITQAIVKAEPQFSVIPTIKETVQSLERVRRFISDCLNVDLKVRLKKLKQGEELSQKERERLEIDWGTIPGVDKPFLKQPGAEKILLWLHLRPRYVKREVELPNGHLEMVASVLLLSKKSGEEVFEGPDCSCSTMESNFRFRWLEREIKPPQSEADKLKAQGLGKWKRKSIWAHGKAVKEDWVWLDRYDNPNIHDERNKVRQIGEKRALVKCIRNLGAMSEIFTADPTEWEFSDEEEVSPYLHDQDFTKSGRQIVTEEGKSPSGEAITYEAKQKEVKKVAEKRIEELKTPKPAEPKPPTDPKKIVQFRWIDEGKFVGLRVQHAALVAAIQQWQGEWQEAEKCWKMPGAYMSDFETLCQMTGYQLVEASGRQPVAPETAAQKGSDKENVNLPSTGPSVAPAAAVVGRIRWVQPGLTKNKQTPKLDVNWGGVIYTAFDKKLWPYLEAGMGKEAELIVKGKRDIVGIRRIGNRKFAEDGYTPEISMTEDRPQNTASLFK